MRVKYQLWVKWEGIWEMRGFFDSKEDVMKDSHITSFKVSDYEIIRVLCVP